MPGNITKLIEKSRVSEEDKRNQMMEQALRISEKLQHKTKRKNTKLKAAMTDIFEVFEPYVTKPDLDNPTHYLMAKEFEWLEQRYSRPLIIKAKRGLGIMSKRIGYEWVWTLPVRTPVESMDKDHQKRVEAIYRKKMRRFITRPVVLVLEDVMEGSKYDCAALEAYKEMRTTRGYSRTSIMKAKSELCIASVKKEDKMWYWVMPAQVVKDYIASLLKGGPLRVNEIFEIAMSERGYTAELIRVARMSLGGIQSCFIDGHVCWRDINRHATQLTD